MVVAVVMVFLPPSLLQKSPTFFLFFDLYLFIIYHTFVNSEKHTSIIFLYINNVD